MSTLTHEIRSWIEKRIKPEQIEKYLNHGEGPNGDDINREDLTGRDFIHDELIERHLAGSKKTDPARIRDIIDKACSIETLTEEETSALLNVDDPELWHEMEEAASSIKKRVYDNRIVTFAPLYLSTLCVNNCLYCGFRSGNRNMIRQVLTQEEIAREVEVLAGHIGHKRLIVVYGEHPSSDIDYMVDSIETIYGVEVKTKEGTGAIRRVNVNAPPLSVEDLKRLKRAGIGTYQVFQETYHHTTYAAAHPQNTIKGNYAWRLYCMHRAFEAGIDDVGIGALFGLYHWKFEVMGLVSHARELEKTFGVGPHTISFPRLEHAENAPWLANKRYRVNDEEFRKAVTVLRLAVPYTGMILTARESALIRQSLIPIGITQTDASSRIGIGAYGRRYENQEKNHQQFILGDTRSLDEVVAELARMGFITSFCTAGYRCSRTGKRIMDLLRSGQEGKFCKLNAVLTFREWLNDFASDTTRELGEKIIEQEIREIREQMPHMYDSFMHFYELTCNGGRDLYF